MCGIYGFVSATGDLGAPDHVRATLTAMDRAIFHRGPDDNGTYDDGRCAMGMRRLSIIDLGGGKQPIGNEDGRYWIVFNGEIYNYRRLRDGLLARGHHFKTTSDTECILHLYEERGEACVDELEGMFGFAIWDKERQELFIARDRMGIKPMYFSATPRGLVFGSELKSLIHHPDVRKSVSPEALSHYLSFGTTPPAQSILDGVRKLLPGHLLRYKKGEVTVRRYWQLPHDEKVCDPNKPQTMDDEARTLRGLIREAVRSHLVADVPVGAFLSGGVDSATVVGTMAELGARPKTFSIGFDEAEYNELDAARIIAKKFNTDHHELVVRPDAWALTEELPWYLDEPFADVSAIPTFLVSKLAAEQVKVVLSGDGGDEIFGGYERYGWALNEARRFDWMPPVAKRALHAFAMRLPESALGKNYMLHAAKDAHLRYVDGQSMFPLRIREKLIGPELRAQLQNKNCATAQATMDRMAMLAAAPGDLAKRLMHLDIETYLPLDILTKVDRMTMARSLEARPPLLDHKLVEHAFKLPTRLKLAADGTQKAILKRAVADLLPPEILSRPKKGFGVPIDKWFRGPLAAPAEALLTDKRTMERGWLEPSTVRAIVDEHFRGRRDHALPMWSLMMLELWCRRFLDQTDVVQTHNLEAAHG
jgi:asparagine synthase (glutamine-hydrolysing)